MRRILLALTLGAILIGAVPATASASVSGAERAVEREVSFDGGRKVHAFDVECKRRRSNYYTCDFNFSDMSDSDSRYWSSRDARARVWQYGSRYVVDYRT